ncbi:hypothetical protein GKZ68_05645 [Hymenobacter sp. BRD128]|uniref:hypothetical protein n=1 Tax=Hymenobacter sp. BRD128 TaxID=2675878 RepID=UPI001566BAA0|nr:hypothetical protein [Hymenobacter sp. BRD128]QKG56173.1 hypothetical protein GKZ68_05645 [Hymenobacter sp. BRD128]
MRAEMVNDEPEVRIRRVRPTPRRGGASTVVIEKDKKGRVVNLTVDGQRVETEASGKKAKRAKKVRTVEVVTVPAQPLRIERLERLERPEMPDRPERPEARSFSFNFSTNAITNEALRAARQGLAEAMRNPDLTTEQRQEMEKELRKLDKEDPRVRVLQDGREVREFHIDVNSAAAGHASHPVFHLERNKRGYVSVKINGTVRNSGGEDARQLERDAERNAERDAERAVRDAERDAERAVRDAERDANRAESSARRAELRARIAAAEDELRALDGRAGRPTPSRPPRPPRAPLAPLGPMSPQAPPPPPAPPAPKTEKLRGALRQDGLIGKDDRSYSFQLTGKGGRVNGKDLTPAQVARYRQLLGQPASGKGKSSTFNINVNEE